MRRFNRVKLMCILRAREALRQCVPDALKDGSFTGALKDDTTTTRWLAQLIFNMDDANTSSPIS